ncbi:unnamed protein product [Bursaphelenchus okinawaensis]|uniref:Uncharacterized protein n=1 Tax=Bursaphelenchus okinawaensis TaxID=465554 RepID=A0A811KDI0_9BILA|nr:unnamed protein product [Bursaphelenchus okinawaensis]CAG9101085.1 unnamed protein product [Bursaphelenchus okinawaensis]
MVATYFPALFSKIAALALLSQFTDSTNELEAVRYMQCKSTELTSGKPAGVFKKVSSEYKLLQLYPVNTALDSIVFNGLRTVDDKTQLIGLSLLKLKPGESKVLKTNVHAEEPQFGVADGHIFYQDCQKTKDINHFDMTNVGQEVSMTNEGLTICGKPEFGLTNDGLVWTKAEGCWKLDGNDLKPSGCSDVTELVFTVEALVNMDPTISQDVDQSDLKTLLILVHSQLAPQTTTTITTTLMDDTTTLDDTEDTFSTNTTRPPYTGEGPRLLPQTAALPHSPAIRQAPALPQAPTMTPSPRSTATPAIPQAPAKTTPPRSATPAIPQSTAPAIQVWHGKEQKVVRIFRNIDQNWQLEQARQAQEGHTKRG